MYSVDKIIKSDVRSLAKMHGECFQEHWSESDFANMLELDPFCGFIARDSDSDCGFIFAKKIFDEIEIITFCVLPKYRKRGVGKALLAALIAISEHARFFLEVAVDNFAAISLYDRAGFEKISMRAGYYNRNNRITDAIVMRLIK